MAKAVDAPIEYDPDFNGPLRKRGCTDVLCLLLFACAIAAWVVVCIYAFKHGDSTLLLVPKDSEGRRCGHDSGLEDKPNLLFFDLIKCASPAVPFTGCKTTQMCVKECPKETFIFNEMTHSYPEVLEKLICIQGVKLKSMEDVKKAIDKDQCARWYVESKSVNRYCLYNFLPSSFQSSSADTSYKEKYELELIAQYSQQSLSWFSLFIHKTLAKFVPNLNQIFEIMHKIFLDLSASSYHIIGGLVAGMIICLIYIGLLRYTVSLITWSSIFAVIAGLAYIFYRSTIKYIEVKNKPAPDVPLGMDETTLESILAAEKTWLILTITSGVLWTIIVLMTFFLRKRITLAIALIEEGSKAISSVRLTLFFPIIPWIFQMVILILGIACFMYLTTIGEMLFAVQGQVNNGSDCVCKPELNYKDGSACTVEDFTAGCKSHSNPGQPCSDAVCHYRGVLGGSNAKILHGVNGVVCLWVLFFLSAFGQMVLAGTFATWYWTFHKKDVPFFSLTRSIYRTCRYHLGTIAFGSLIITICRIIRISLEYMHHKLKKYDNSFTRAIMWCLRCFFWCLERFLKFINRNAYIMCAIHGKNFCLSAKDAFFLLVRNVIRVFVLDKVTDFIFFVGKVLLTAIVCYGAYAVFIYKPEWVKFPKEINYVLTPVVIIGFGTYLVASLFFSVYEMAVETLFLCFLEDSERNDGSPDKPYFMSKNLMKILHKKNKIE